MEFVEPQSGWSDTSKAFRSALYLGVFLVSAAVLMFEILITRLISVATWHYFAFLAVSLAMFGMSAGAVRVFYKSSRRSLDTVLWLTESAAFAGLSTALSIVVFVFLPVQLTSDLVNLAALTVALLLFALPFYFGGVCIALALTQFSSVFSKVYAADLVGGAAGCILVVGLSYLLDGPSVGLAVALVFAWASCSFGMMEPRMPSRLPAVSIALCALLLSANVISSGLGQPLINLHWVKGRCIDWRPEYEKWTPISYITVYPYWKHEPFGWGFGSRAVLGAAAQQRFLSIDGQAGTVLTEFHGDLSKINYLKFDLSNLAHHLRSNANVLVIGVGGGRDILSALAFQQNSIVGVELNDAIVDVVTNKFADFCGNLTRQKGVEIVNAEARSYLEGTKKQFDIIQASLIDTWAATTTGAYALAENSLYTVEGWQSMFDRLSDKGILSFTRWYIPSEPYELYRLCAIARAALEMEGITDAGRHIVVQVLLYQQQKSIVTLLVSKKPWTEADLERIAEVGKECGFRSLYSPKASSDDNLALLINSKPVTPGESNEFIDNYPVDISATSDDRPFFFNFERLANVRLFDFSRLAQWKATGDAESHYGHASHALIYCLILCSVLACVCVTLPAFAFRRSKSQLTRDHFLPSITALLYCGALGAGFMFIEVSIMLRQSVFLGHPTVGMIVVLPSMLVSSGLGSFVCAHIERAKLKRQGIILLSTTFAVVVVFHALAEVAYFRFAGFELVFKALIAALLIVVPAFFMGMAMPLGMRRFDQRGNAVSWFWAVNGATSILASVSTVAISLAFGISSAYYVGAACYLVALNCWILYSSEPQ